MRRSAVIALTCVVLAGGDARAGKEMINFGSGTKMPVLAQNTDRRIPGRPPPSPPERDKINPELVPLPQPNLPREFIPIPDRWRLMDSLGLKTRWWDPYNQNYLKADRPIFGTNDLFFNLNVISDTVIEPRAVPTGRSPSGSSGSGALDTFGDTTQFQGVESLITSLSIIKGDTAFRPPDFELRLTPVINGNFVRTSELGVLKRDPGSGRNRVDHFVALQEGFIDYHIRNVSDRYDFDSVRVGIQPFSSDFRGFLFQDNQLGVRLFGTRDNNIFQYNVGWFRRLEKDTNSGLNDITRKIRDDDIFIGNLYVQDFPTLGFVSQLTGIYNRNREGKDFFFNENQFLERPASFGDERGRNYDVGYFGYNGDGHFGRVNLTVSAYYAYGRDGHNQLNGTDPENDEAMISAYFMAAEPSVDFDWLRLRGSFLFASGDKDPFDDRETGFATIFENPQFAGGDTSYWIRQGIPLIGGGGVALTQRNGVLASLKTSKEHGQSNFNNPGVILAGFGTDMDILPELRLSTNVNSLWMDETAVVEALRNQGDIASHLGYDLSAALIYRPFQSQNIVFRLSTAFFVGGDGFKDLFASAGDPSGTGEDIYYSVLGNIVLAY
jgi:hypothetical protein